ncbi:MAG: hypothetical protein IKT25_01345, partial [Firmicutes bacterium]|nr:hypothetical protein [Bacillota bacterium]
MLRDPEKQLIQRSVESSKEKNCSAKDTEQLENGMKTLKLHSYNQTHEVAEDSIAGLKNFGIVLHDGELTHQVSSDGNHGTGSV